MQDKLQQIIDEYGADNFWPAVVERLRLEALLVHGDMFAADTITTAVHAVEDAADAIVAHLEG